MIAAAVFSQCWRMSRCLQQPYQSDRKKISPWFLSKNNWFHWFYKQEDFHACSRSQCLSFLELLPVSATSEEDEKKNLKIHLTSFKQRGVTSADSRWNWEAWNFEFLNTETPLSFRSQNWVLFWRCKLTFTLKIFPLFVYKISKACLLNNLCLEYCLTLCGLSSATVLSQQHFCRLTTAGFGCPVYQYYLLCFVPGLVEMRSCFISFMWMEETVSWWAFTDIRASGETVGLFKEVCSSLHARASHSECKYKACNNLVSSSM